MKQLVFFFLLFIQGLAWSQSDTARFVIRTAGFYSEHDEYDELKDSIAKKWDITYLPVAGCMSTTEFTDSIKHLNNLTSKRLEVNYGPDWKERLKQEVDAAYKDLSYKKKTTFQETANCTQEEYSFKAAENLSQTEMKFTVIPKRPVNQNNHDVRLMGLQHVDHTILYRGYDNRIILEFGSFADPINASIKSKGELQLLDSCPASTKIQLGYRPQGSIGQDTLFVETTDGKVHEFIFKLQNLAPPGIYFNEQIIDSTISISKFYTTSVLSMHYDQTCLVPSRLTIHTWEISHSGNKRHLGRGNIIPISVIRKLKKLNPGTKCCIQLTFSTPDSVLRKKIVCFTLI